ncbi:porin [Paraburkholderia fungorum]|uniref:Porin n=1 Tax=Paraburkholderia fungorum TaxID=134537 RepID=A0AAP5UY35_9BURK|nr:porin [Paraburkholderia fungorum]MDT8843645.1 porin [Paraburkholderia fungorum]
MRRRLILATVSAALSAPAFAQSSVTLYGLIDAGLNYTVGSQKAVTNGHPVGSSNQLAMFDGAFGLAGSRWGIKGIEDLGGGLKAVFTLENGFTINNGALAQGGAEFGRQAYVGLDSRYGRLTLGRQYDPHLDIVAPFSAAWQFAGYLGTHPDDVDNLLSTRRLNNSIKYTMPKLYGLNAEALYSVGGVAGSLSRDQAWSLAISYDGGPVQAGVGYLSVRNPNVSFYGANPNGTGVTGNNLGSLGSATSAESNPLYAGFASANTYNLFGAGASYALGGLTAGVLYTNVRYTGLGNVSTSGPNPLGYTGTGAINTAEVNLRYSFTPALLLGAMASATRAASVGGHEGAWYREFGVGAGYFLSKRTELYVTAVYERASGTDSTGRAAVATISGVSPSATNAQTAFRVAIQHRF